MPSRNFLCVLTDDLTTSRDWYVALLDYRVAFDSDWFVQLEAADAPNVELGLLLRTHEIVPERAQRQPVGGMLTVVVDDVDVTHRRAMAMGVEIVEAPRDLFYGQRRMLVVDPDGQLVDISSECPPDPVWLASLG